MGDYNREIGPPLPKGPLFPPMRTESELYAIAQKAERLVCALDQMSFFTSPPGAQEYIEALVLLKAALAPEYPTFNQETKDERPVISWHEPSNPFADLTRFFKEQLYSRYEP